jgi:transposase-like protein
MENKAFRALMKALKQLNPRQPTRLREALMPRVQNQVSETVQALMGPCSSCPHCGSNKLYRHGRGRGLQRHRCKACGRTFTSLTGTALERLHHKDKWLTYAQRMLRSETVRQAAATAGVHRNTSFRWRHRFLNWTKDDRPQCLHGITEADETYLLESEKGARQLVRKARKRGGSATKRGISDEQICILVARDRTGQTLDFVTGKGPVTKQPLHACLPPVLDTDSLLVSDGNPTYHYFAQALALTHEAVNLSAGVRVRGAYHVQNVNAYHSRLKYWLDHFHGVATKYLPNYLGWRRAIDAHRLHTPELLLRASVGIFPHTSVT